MVEVFTIVALSALIGGIIFGYLMNLTIENYFKVLLIFISILFVLAVPLNLIVSLLSLQGYALYINSVETAPIFMFLRGIIFTVAIRGFKFL